MITHHYVHVFVMATDWDLIPFFVQTRFNHFTQTQAWTQTWRLEGKELILSVTGFAIFDD